MAALAIPGPPKISIISPSSSLPSPKMSSPTENAANNKPKTSESSVEQKQIKIVPQYSYKSSTNPLANSKPNILQKHPKLSPSRSLSTDMNVNNSDNDNKDTIIIE